MMKSALVGLVLAHLRFHDGTVLKTGNYSFYGVHGWDFITACDDNDNSLTKSTVSQIKPSVQYNNYRDF